jgi:single-strand DNA-binding protein
MLNRVCLVGRLGRDVELKKTGNGKSFAFFSLVVGRNFKTSDGQDADFITVVCWGKVAENTAQYCSKGSLVSIDGRLQTRNYENNGQKVYVTEVVADSVQFIDTRKKENAQAHKQEAPKHEAPKQETTPTFDNSAMKDFENEIQF